MTSYAAAPVTAASLDRRQLSTMGGAMLGFFVVALDAQIVNVALPNIGTTLGGGLTGLRWVVTDYTLTFSALTLFAGTGGNRGWTSPLIIGLLAAALVAGVVFLTAQAKRRHPMVPLAMFGHRWSAGSAAEP